MGEDTPMADIGGTVTGLATGATLTLSENQAVALSVSGNGAFEFPGGVPANDSYTVSVTQQPAGQTCTVSNGSGTVDAAGDPVQTVSVTCANNAGVSGTVTGLPDGAQLVLSDGLDQLTVTTNGNFTLPASLAPGASYTVAVQTQPAAAQCSVANASGSIDAAGDAATGVAVTCVPSGTLSGMVTGLADGAQLVLGDGTSTVVVNANGPFAFADVFPAAAVYTVAVTTPPNGQTCTINAAGSGAFDSSDDPVTGIVVTCL